MLAIRTLADYHGDVGEIAAVALFNSQFAACSLVYMCWRAFAASVARLPGPIETCVRAYQMDLRRNIQMRYEPGAE